MGDKGGTPFMHSPLTSDSGKIRYSSISALLTNKENENPPNASCHITMGKNGKVACVKGDFISYLFQAIESEHSDSVAVFPEKSKFANLDPFKLEIKPQSEAELQEASKVA